MVGKIPADPRLGGKHRPSDAAGYARVSGAGCCDPCLGQFANRLLAEKRQRVADRDQDPAAEPQQPNRELVPLDPS
jgi:hypothetical protein